MTTYKTVTSFAKAIRLKLHKKHHSFVINRCVEMGYLRLDTPAGFTPCYTLINHSDDNDVDKVVESFGNPFFSRKNKQLNNDERGSGR